MAEFASCLPKLAVRGRRVRMIRLDFAALQQDNAVRSRECMVVAGLSAR